MKRYLNLFLIVLFTVILFSCSGGSSKETQSAKLPTIDENTETELTVWGWNVAAKALMEAAKTFNEKYPKIKINVQEFGGGLSAYERYGVVLASGKEIPDLMQIESDYVATYVEAYPQHFLDLKNYIDIEGKVDPSKVPTSYDTHGKLVAIPWDSGPVVMFYRADMFAEAGIDPNSIVTYDDYIAAGKKLQAKFPNTKMNGFYFSKEEPFWSALLVQNNVFYLNTKGEITISSDKSIEALRMVKKQIDEGIVLNTVNWDGAIRASKNNEIATQIIGGWWAGTIKDQMPEMKGKWKIMPIPAYTKNGIRASSGGGSELAVTASEPLKQAAAIEFIKETLMNVDTQLMMYEKFGLFPSYLPVYDDPRFQEPDPYFGENFNQILSEVTKNISPVIYNSEDFSEIRNIAISTYEDVINNNKDIPTALEEAANQISSSTGRSIAK